MLNNKFIKRIRSFSKRFDLLKDGAKIVVGVSGGPDSVCLLDILVSLKKRYNFELLIAHINYGLRGLDSDGDEIFVRKLAEKYDLRIFVLDAKRESKFEQSENSLRNIRYEFFEKTRKEFGFDAIAVAHNKDDQAETILMRLIRGAGLLGLGSMRPRNGIIIRPLLETSRKEIIEYLKVNKLKYKIDKTNKESNFLRNKIRNKLIPYLEKNYNLSIRETLSGAVGNIADDYDFINKESLRIAGKICNFKGNKVEFSVGKIKELHPAIQKQVLRQAILGIKKNLNNVDNSHIEELLKIVLSKKGKTQKVNFRGLKAERKGDKLSIVI